MPRKPVTDEDIKNFIGENNINVEFIKLELIKDKSGRIRHWVNYTCNCGNPHKAMWSNFKKTQSCSECGTEKRRNAKIKYSREYVEKYLNENGYKIVGEYINSGVSFLYKCLTCENTGKTNFGSFLDGRRCKVCQGFSKKDTRTFSGIVSEITDGEYVFLGEYETAHIKSEFLHRTCHNTYDASPHNFLQGKRCPFCNSSKGEKKIEDFLLKNNLLFESQYRFNNCRNILPLPFDFAIFNEENNLIYLIEFDGRQHFEAIACWGGEDNFNYIKKNDEIKNTFCADNDISLIRIPYWNFNKIEEILKDELIFKKDYKEDSHASVT